MFWRKFRAIQDIQRFWASRRTHLCDKELLLEIVLETIIWFRNLWNLLIAFWISIIFQMKSTHWSSCRNWHTNRGIILQEFISIVNHATASLPIFLFFPSTSACSFNFCLPLIGVSFMCFDRKYSEFETFKTMTHFSNSGDSLNLFYCIPVCMMVPRSIYFSICK